MSKKDIEILILPGGEVKSIESDDELGTIKGSAILFGSPDQPDRSKKRDYFTKDTLVRKYSDVFTVELFHDHGDVYTLPIGEAVMTKSDDGWSAECKLDLTDPFAKHIYEDMKKGGYGFSTGALSHLVQREAKENNTHFIKQWVTGELSVTKRPAEERTLGVSVKSSRLYESLKSLEEEYGDENKSEDHSFSTTQINLLEPQHQNVIDFGKSFIKQEDLDKEGLESNPHITVKYGIHADSSEEFKSILESQPQFTLTLGKTSIFEVEGKTYDVVKVDVISEDIKSFRESKSINELITKNSTNTETNPEYIPHLTIGYVTKGTGDKYTGDTTLEGTVVNVKQVTFVSHNGHETLIELKAKEEDLDVNKFLVLTGDQANPGLLNDMLEPISSTIAKLKAVDRLLPKEYWGDWTFISDIVYSLESAQLKIIQINTLLQMDESFFKSKDITKSDLVGEVLKATLTANTPDGDVALKNQLEEVTKELEDLKLKYIPKEDNSVKDDNSDSPISLSAEEKKAKLSMLEEFLAAESGNKLQVIQ